MNNSKQVLNELLVDLFNNILRIEERALQDIEGHDLSVTEMHTLEAIGTEGERSMSEAAKKLNITVGTLTTAIAKLMAKGYVERRRTDEDKRVVLVKLTEKGRIANSVHERFHQEMIKDTLEQLSPDEEEILRKSLEKLTDFFKEKYESKG
ncbi:MarR family winged helix-turn-helix transcriptional regulator [Youngiibacter multivorans]|uniref:DNA-binding MarR family transcriptional regulator n=1 Tax=Youngiibacter multivorans TaxID=937251 RepID=A0ABS4G1P7_9CLOT|nr:MarR family transcriptional regulator [Youngiibacter multivorans]MBP1918468.1 DNA-binding MarR family transcriptional regulator [Youngiibacter multivorans]